jgi:signal transduction histidine kinase
LGLDRQWVSILGTAIGYGLLAVPLVLRLVHYERTRPTGILLLTYVLSSMVWAWSRELSSWKVVAQPWPTIAHIAMVYGAVVLAALLGMLTTVFLRHYSNQIWLWMIGGAGVALAMAGLDWAGLQWAVWSEISLLSLAESLSVIGWLVLSGAAYSMGLAAYRKTRRPLHRNRLRYWMLVLVFVLVGDSLFIFSSFPFDQLGTLLHWLGTALAYAVLVSYQLPHLSSVVRRVLRYVVLTLVTALIYLWGIFLVEYLPPLFAPVYSIMFNAALAALLLAVLYPLLRRWTEAVLNRVLFGVGYDREQIVREYSRGISNILDLDVLATVALRIISEAMDIERGALLVCEHSSDLTLRPVKGVGLLDVEPMTIDPASSPIACMVETAAPLSQYDLDFMPQHHDLSAQVREWFSSLEMELYVPICSQGQLEGILALGAKISGDPYTPADNALLRTLGGQTAVALKNARLVEDLRQLNTEVTQLNEDLTSSNARLAILDKTKSDFISIASHELKTPLTQIRGYTDILLEMSQQGELPPGSVQRMTEGIARGSERLQIVVEAMLDVSLIEAEAFYLHPLAISLAQLLERVVVGLEAAFQERQQAISVVGFDDLPDIVADETRLHQAFRNIIINSVKFTPDEGLITVRGRAISQGKEVEIAIADTGIGIDPADQALIFEKFYRVGDLNLHSSGQTKFKGAGPGLGLPIAKGIVEAHGGRIWVESRGCNEETCPGSTFYVVLPVDGPSGTESTFAI